MDWPVDTALWTIADKCLECQENTEKDDKKQLARYKELYLLLTVKGEMEFDQVCEWCVGQMKDVYSDRSDNMNILYMLLYLTLQ
jgi:hypothetical protein